MTAPLAYRRILLKLSGEALMGAEDYGIDPKILQRLAREVIEARDAGAEIALVIGGGNIFRGAGLAAGLACGAFNGFFVAYVGMPSFVVTLGMLSIARSLAVVLSGNQMLYQFGPDAPIVKAIGQAKWPTRPVQMICPWGAAAAPTRPASPTARCGAAARSSRDRPTPRASVARRGHRG